MGFVLPTAVIGFGVVIPRSCIAGVNELTIGFASTIVGACVTYALGLRQALPRTCRFRRTGKLATDVEEQKGPQVP
jgi:hypothetical protein